MSFGKAQSPLSSTSRPLNVALRGFLAQTRQGAIDAPCWLEFTTCVLANCLTEPEQLLRSSLKAVKQKKPCSSPQLWDEVRKQAIEIVQACGKTHQTLAHLLCDTFEIHRPKTPPVQESRKRKANAEGSQLSTAASSSSSAKRARSGVAEKSAASLGNRPLYGFHLLKTSGVGCKGDAYVALDEIVVAGAHLAVICNFKFDMDWMWQRAPALHTFGRIIIVHGGDDDEEKQWRQFVESQGLSERVRFVKPTLPAYGTMHSKMFVLFYASGCRVCIHTANMLESDWDYKTQAAYMRDFPIRILSDVRQDRAAFHADLCNYLARCLPAEENCTVRTALDTYDFDSAGAAIVSSVPGIHKEESRFDFGHARLRVLLADERITHSAADSVAICQFSSLGSIQEKWMNDEFATTLFTQSGDSIDAACAARARGEIQLVYPTCAQVEASNEGLQAGASIPVPGRNLNRAHITSKLHKWDASRSGRQAAMPHIKTFLRYASTSPGQAAWLFVGSFNLSVAAWGRMQGARGKKPWNRLNILSYEIGVLLSPRLACAPRFALPDAVVKYSLATEKEQSMWDKAKRDGTVSLALHTFDTTNSTYGGNQVTTLRLPLPYAVPPAKYEQDDVAWTIERCNMM